MGCASSSPVTAVPGGGIPVVDFNIENLNPVQKRIVVALQATKQKPEYEEVNFTKILLKFVKIRKTLNLVKEIFASVDVDEDGEIDESEIDTCLKKLKSDIAGEELHDFFTVSAVSKTAQTKEEGMVKKLNQKEFLVALIVCYVLRSIPALATPKARRMSIDKLDVASAMNAGSDAEQSGRSENCRPIVNKRRASVTGLFNKTNDQLRENFDLMVHAYLLFDKNGKGFIAKTDVGNMMDEEGNAKNKGTGGDANALQENRWAEMDWNNDGTIEFSEFIYTFSKWVDIDED